MGTLNAIYVRITNPSMATAYCETYPSAYTEPGTPFYANVQPENCFDCPAEELQAISECLNTDVIWLSFQSVSNSFQYHHWQVGKNFVR